MVHFLACKCHGKLRYMALYSHSTSLWACWHNVTFIHCCVASLLPCNVTVLPARIV